MPLLAGAFSRSHTRRALRHAGTWAGFRNPALTAKIAASLHFLTQGRFILGIGAGWKEDEFRAYGYPYPPPAVRIAQLEEAVRIIVPM